MAKCPKCGTELINGSIFCGFCGERIPDGFFDIDDTVDFEVNDSFNDSYNDSVNTSYEKPVMMQGQPIGGTGKAPSVTIDGQTYEAYVPEADSSNTSSNSDNYSANQNTYSNPGSYSSNQNSYNNQGNYSNTASYSDPNANNAAVYNNYNYQNTAPATKTNTCCVAGMIIGILSLISCGLFCGILPIAGIIVSIIGIKQADELGENGKGMGIAGLVTSIIALVGLVMILIFTVFVSYI